MTPEEAKAFGLVATMRLREQIVKNGNFECESCFGVFPMKKCGSLGAFAPHDKIVTEAGPKERIVAYALCRNCSDRVLKGDRTVSDAVEANLTRKGIFLDPTYNKFVNPSEEEFERWAKDVERSNPGGDS